jgi:signal transduction histidine kinase
MRNFTTTLIYFAVIARAIGWNYETASIPVIIWILLGVFGAILFSQQALTRRFPLYPRVYTMVQSGLVEFFGARIGFAWIGVFSLAMASMFLFGLEWQTGLTMLLGSGSVNLLMGSFAHMTTRTEQSRQENQRMFGELQEAYRQLKDSATQAEALAAATERHRLVRELHDSLTQTLFSMNLAVQSAQLAMEEAPQQTDKHLVILQTLARSAAGEVQALTGQAPQRPPTQGGLAASLQKLAEQRLAQDGLQVRFEVMGQRALPEGVEAALYRITQEALNNIGRHAGVQQAVVRLHLEGPTASLEIEDAGCGFDLESQKRSGGYGLVGMAERAAEIGWELQIQSYPGQGTHIRVEGRTS